MYVGWKLDTIDMIAHSLISYINWIAEFTKTGVKKCVVIIEVFSIIRLNIDRPIGRTYF